MKSENNSGVPNKKYSKEEIESLMRKHANNFLKELGVVGGRKSAVVLIVATPFEDDVGCGLEIDSHFNVAFADVLKLVEPWLDSIKQRLVEDN